jgi:hypothetical protein
MSQAPPPESRPPLEMPPVQPPLPHLSGPTKPDYDPVVGAIIPIGRSGWAIASGYLGLFSVLLIFAPLALLTGILALRDIAANPQKHGKGRAVFGIIMGTLGTVLPVWILVETLVKRR